MADYDSPWKEAIEVFFQPFLALFYPHIEADIDWSRGFVFLDKELQKILPKAKTGRLYVDKLVKVWRKNGDEEWVLIHIEVQAQRDSDFPRRMYGYNTRLFDVYNRTVVSLAVLIDDEPGWRPNHFEAKLWGWSVRMEWETAKLLDFKPREAELQQSANPFAKVVLAQLAAMETRDDPDRRGAIKFKLIRDLYEQGFSKESIDRLFGLIDWVIDLSERDQEKFEADLDNFKRESAMRFYSFVEKAGLKMAVEALLQSKFGDEGMALMPSIARMRDGEAYMSLIRAIGTATTLPEVRKAITKAAAAARRRHRIRDAEFWERQRQPTNSE